MGKGNTPGDPDGWARLRFAVVGPLLAAPPPKGRLRGELERLASQVWQRPGGGEVSFSVSTIERWGQVPILLDNLEGRASVFGLLTGPLACSYSSSRSVLTCSI